jgi:diguanylate cyclase (GGDEF)-like protein
MPGKPPPSARAAFRRGSNRILFAVAVLATIGFALLAAQGVEVRTRRMAHYHARLFNVALGALPEAERLNAVERLQQGESQFLAFGMLTPNGQLAGLYPSPPGYRAAVVEALPGSATEGMTTARVHLPEQSAWVITLPLNGDLESPLAQRAVFVLARESYFATWQGATLSFALGMLVVVGMVGHFYGQWFERSFLQPLRLLASNGRNDSGRGGRSYRGSFPWREAQQLEDQVENLFHELVEAKEKLRHEQERTREQLRASEIGFERQLKRAKEQALMDALTGLRNRHFLESELESFVQKHCAQGFDLAVVMIDVDNFKCHNDTFGHEAGDELLRFIGALLRGSLRPHDAAIRYGGDEFMLLLSDVNAREAAQVVSRLVKLFGQFASQFKSERQVSLSAGVTSLSQQRHPTANSLVKAADAALYRAKHAGKNNVSVAGPARG